VSERAWSGLEGLDRLVALMHRVAGDPAAAAHHGLLPGTAVTVVITPKETSEIPMFRDLQIKNKTGSWSRRNAVADEMQAGAAGRR
jgi:hypothetical protein